MKTEDKSVEMPQEQDVRTQAAEAATEQKPGTETEDQESEAGTAAKESTHAKAKSRKASMPEWLKPYAKRYPSAKLLHVTGDRQVFLDKDYCLAKLHQRNLGQGDIKSYNI